MTRWWWLRHAPTSDGSADTIAARDAPADLTRLPRHSLPKNALWLSSPQPRALTTARALAPPDAVIALDPRLAEQDFGAWHGRRHDDLWRDGDAAYRRFWQEPCAGKPPGGESVYDQQSRVAAALAEYRATGDIVAVAHAGTIRAALAVALELPPPIAWRFVLTPGGLTRIDWLAEGWRVLSVNQEGARDD